MNISFCPATSGSAQVLIKRRGQLILTASEQDSLFYIDLPSCIAGARSAELTGNRHLALVVKRDRRAGEISIRQAAKAKGHAEAFGVAGDRRTIPMSSAVYGSLKCAKPGDEMADKTEYQSGIGSLLHMAQCVRPDIAAPVGALAAFGSAPTAVHFGAMLDVIGYVGATAERGISYARSDVAVKIWCDANFAACMDTRRSWSGWVVALGGL
jgi:hypothetical protein